MKIESLYDNLVFAIGFNTQVGHYISIDRTGVKLNKPLTRNKQGPIKTSIKL